MTEETSRRSLRPLDVLVKVTDDFGAAINGAKVELLVATRDAREYLEVYREHAGQPGVVEMKLGCLRVN